MTGEISGIGIDIVDIDRMDRILSEKGKERVFTPDEISFCEGKARPMLHFSARFAAKEAVIKALGIGKEEGMVLGSIEIINSETGAPTVALRDDLIRFNTDHSIMISISHTEETAAAFAIVMRK